MSNARHEAAPTSPKSDRATWVRALDRRALRIERGLFRVEGPQAVREALRFPKRGAIQTIYLTDEAAERHAEIASSPLAQRVPASVIAAMSEASTPQGVVAIAHLPRATMEEVGESGLIVVAVDVRDPGNLGTMIRTADAMGAGGFICANSCVDPFAPKVIRSAVGSHWHLPVIADIQVHDAINWARTRGLQVLAADGESTTSIDQVDLSKPTAWLLGNEAWGLPESVAEAADESVGVPIYGQAESLNVAIASALLMYASAQAQRTGH